MKNRSSRKGSTLVEVLVSFAILTTTGVFMQGLLFRSPTTDKVWIDNYGQELSKIIILTTNAQNDTVIEHSDANGAPWETIVKIDKEDAETCLTAVSIKARRDTTRTLHYCKYGGEK